MWLVAAMVMALTCAMAFLDFVPAYLAQVCGLSASKASMYSSAMPFGSLIGLVASILFYDRFSRKQLRLVLTGTLVIASLCVLGLQLLPQLELPRVWNLGAVLGLVFLFGVVTSPAYYIPMSIFSIEFGGPHSATLVCLIDMSGFAASATFGFAASRLAAGDGGWTSFMTLLLVIGISATAFTWLFTHGEYKAARVGKG